MQDIPYDARVTERAMRLERQTTMTRREIIATRSLVERNRDELGRELELIREELIRIDAAVSGAVARMQRTVRALQGVTKQQELRKLQQRIDAWAPEQRLSRPALKKLLEDENS